MYTHDAVGLIVVYDMTHSESLDIAIQCIEDVMNNSNDPQNLVVALVGNKSDLIYK